MAIYTLTYFFPNFEPVHCSMSGSNCCFLTCILEILSYCSFQPLDSSLLLILPWSFEGGSERNSSHLFSLWCLLFIGGTDVEAETPILWPPKGKSWLTGKDPNARKDWRSEKGTTEDEMVGWHHQLNGREFEQAPGVGDGQGSLAFCSPWARKQSDMTEQLNWTLE